jgi:uncharacterized protein YjbI with pentapeptide repeats
MSNPEHLAKLQEGVSAWNQWRRQNPDLKVDLSGSYLRKAALDLANLSGAALREANLSRAMLSGAQLEQADMRAAKLSNANLTQTNFSGARLNRADLYGATLRWASLRKAEMTDTTLTAADLLGADLSSTLLRQARLDSANLTAANMCQADLFAADLRSAILQKAILDKADLSEARLWETQRAGWSIKGIICQQAYWDEQGKEPTAYDLGEFERLHSDQTCIELFYQASVSSFEISTLPALLHHLTSRHPGHNIRLKSIEEAAGGAKISISVGEASREIAEKIKADAEPVYQFQLAMRNRSNEETRSRFEKEHLDGFVSEKIVMAMLAAVTRLPQNEQPSAPIIVNNYGKMEGLAIAAGNARQDVKQTINDNTAILALLEKMMDRHADLGLASPDAAKLQSELQSATSELQKKAPDKSILSKSLGLIQKLATEAATRAASKVGESVVSADWQSWLHQLGQFVHHLN